MHKLILTGLAAGALSLSACDNSAKAPSTEAEAITALDAAQANLDAFRTCPADKVLTDITSYSNEMADASLEQKEWFEANGKRNGVITTATGLQYSVNKKGTATGTLPLSTQTVRVNYHGQFLDGKIFDSSYERGQDIEFPLNGVIKGWTEGVGLMAPCAAWTFYIPSDLAYGPRGRKPSIPPATPLVFHIQLIGITD